MAKSNGSQVPSLDLLPRKEETDAVLSATARSQYEWNGEGKKYRSSYSDQRRRMIV